MLFWHFISPTPPTPFNKLSQNLVFGLFMRCGCKSDIQIFIILNFYIFRMTQFKTLCCMGWWRDILISMPTVILVWNLTGQCMYNGVPFNEGQTWNDGCDLKCSCENGTTGYYRCSDRLVNVKFRPFFIVPLVFLACVCWMFMPKNPLHTVNNDSSKNFASYIMRLLSSFFYTPHPAEASGH